ncbi:MAG: DUF1016 N-terminal domain-containing protein [Flavobacteriaceae bacterium]|nr:DUF1016 N-terminal domain-containing protein [Flavobacteriaceae bacterium]
MSKKQDIQSDKTHYSSLVSTIEVLVSTAKKNIAETVNQTITITYWHIGQHIVEYEQKGKERAEYGTKLLKNLSEDLTRSFGKGYSYRNLKLIKKFYLTFSNWQSVIVKSSNEKGQSLIALFEKDDKPIGQPLIAQSLNTKLQTAITKLSWTHFVRLLSVKNKTN